MELTLTHHTATQVSVNCNGQVSHTFDLRTLVPDEKHGLPQPIDDPVAYGKAVYQALFPPETPSRRALAAMPNRILLVTTSAALDAVAWEYAYGADDFLVLEYPFVRGLPADQRIDPPLLDGGLHIVAIPSNPIAKSVPPLNIDSEWTRLKETIQEVPSAITLERTRPPTIEQARRLVANQRNRIIHFMGHGGQHESGAVLLFEKNNGDLDPVTAKVFLRRVRGAVFLVTLNACVSATPGPTVFSNLAAALVQQRTPYALGMRLSIVDDDARAFSREFYSELARGVPVEEALYQARLTLAKSLRRWVVGVPVLYTALSAPATGFASISGAPVVKEHQPRIEVSTLPRAEGIFQGRIDELKEIGTYLTGDTPPRLLTIHGAGGQGKTALAREAVERFACAWPGGVWATTLENLPSREVFVNDLARFLGIDTQNMTDPNEIERQVVAQLNQRRTLIVLDNAETLVEAIKVNNEAAIRLAQFIREQLPSPPVSMLATSRSYLGWNGEIGLEHDLEGLEPDEGAQLFRQSAPQRKEAIDLAQAEQLSREVEGHPLSLRLLGGAFNASAISLPAFIKEHEAQLLQAENKYVGPEHRQRTLYASIDTSVRYLDAELRALFSGLWIFHAPFLPETAVAIFDLKTHYSEGEDSPVYNQLHTLWLRGLLVRETATLRDGTVLLYRLLPTMCPYVEQHLEQAYEREALQAQFGAAYTLLTYQIGKVLDQSAAMNYIARQAREDLERGVSYVTGTLQAHYLLSWASVLQRWGETRHALTLAERALEISQGQDRNLELGALNRMAIAYRALHQPLRALELYEKALPTQREMDDRFNEAVTLNNMGLAHLEMGNPQEAIKLYEQALPIRREVNDRVGEANTLYNLAGVYQALGQPQQSLELLAQALPIMRKEGDRYGEGSTLNNMGLNYRELGQPQRALECYEQALSIIRELGNRSGESAAFNNIGLNYQELGQPQRALECYEQALSIIRELGDRSGEATTLNNMGLNYRELEQPQRALELCEQALSIHRELGNRSGEATTLNNMGAVYLGLEQPQRALECYEQALPIHRELGDRAEEATILNYIGQAYWALGRSQRALEFYKQALSIAQELGDRPSESAALNNMGLVYQVTGQIRWAIECYEQALSLKRGNRHEEAFTLNNMGILYGATGQPQRALELFKQVLPIWHEMGNQDNEFLTLNNIGEVYRTIGQPQRALEFYEQALQIAHEASNRKGEATVLNNMGLAYQALEQPQRALALYEQVLPIWHEAGYRLGEATVLNNIGLANYAMGQPQQALEWYEQALPLRREVGDRAGEAYALNNIGLAYQAMGQPQKALGFYQQALPILHDVEDWAGEAAILANIASLLYKALNRSQEATVYLEQAIAILVETGLPQDAGGQTVSELRQALETIRRGAPPETVTDSPATIPAAQIQQFVTITVAVMTTAQDIRTEWREAMIENLQRAQNIKRPLEAEFFAAILAILEGQPPTLPEGHPYAQAIASIQSGIVAGGP